MTQTNPKKYWFKRRRRGWGWIPVTWQGWLSLLALIGVAIGSAFVILPAKPAQPTAGQLTLYFGVLLVALAALVVLGFAKGPVPRWRWGKRSDDNHDEDF
jgi:uncharacterized membrane protein YhaH (DUF805 family)